MGRICLFDYVDFQKRAALPVLLADLNNRMQEWGTEGKINPFKEVYEVGSIICIFIELEKNVLMSPFSSSSR